MCKLMACVGRPFSLREIGNFYDKFGASNPHAAGYALFHGKSILLGKQPGIGSLLFQRDKDLIAKTLPFTTLGLFHVRFATHGNPQDSRNNHPILHSLNGKVKSMIIHNGMVRVDPKLPVDGQTDTEQILAYWDREGPECLAKFSGSAAIIVMDCGKVYAYHHSAPLYYEQRKDGLYLHQDSSRHSCSVPENVVFEVTSSDLIPVCRVAMKSNYYHIVTSCEQTKGSTMGRLMNHKNAFWSSYQEEDDDKDLENDNSLSYKDLCAKYKIKKNDYSYLAEDEE